jgi:phosphoribosylanthranilate isomerase
VEGTTRPRVKICCIATPEEARLAVRSGAAAIGLVSAMPSGPGVVSERAIIRIAGLVPPPVTAVLLTSRLEASQIVQQQRRCGAGAIQLCDLPAARVHEELRSALPGIRLIQVVHVTGEAAFDEACELAPRVDALLLDSGNRNLAIKELGGTGRTHDWAVSRRIREAVPVPIFLAGGLRPENVAEAIRAVEPFAVDVCTGVRVEGRLVEGKLLAFMEAVRAAGAPPLLS